MRIYYNVDYVNGKKTENRRRFACFIFFLAHVSTFVQQISFACVSLERRLNETNDTEMHWKDTHMQLPYAIIFFPHLLYAYWNNGPMKFIWVFNTKRKVHSCTTTIPNQFDSIANFIYKIDRWREKRGGACRPVCCGQPEVKTKKKKEEHESNSQINDLLSANILKIVFKCKTFLYGMVKLNYRHEYQITISIRNNAHITHTNWKQWNNSIDNVLPFLHKFWMQNFVFVVFLWFFLFRNPCFFFFFSQVSI